MSDEKEPTMILKIKFAKGEITKEEYEQKMNILRSELLTKHKEQIGDKEKPDYPGFILKTEEPIPEQMTAITVISILLIIFGIIVILQGLFSFILFWSMMYSSIGFLVSVIFLILVLIAFILLIGMLIGKKWAKNAVIRIVEILLFPSIVLVIIFGLQGNILYVITFGSGTIAMGMGIVLLLRLELKAFLTNIKNQDKN